MVYSLSCTIIFFANIIANAVIDPLDWDSDAEGQGDGEWVAGEWVPKPFVRRKQWWKKDDQEEAEQTLTSPDTKSQQRKNQSSDAIVVVTAGETRSFKPPKKNNKNKVVFLSDPENKPLVSTLTAESKGLCIYIKKRFVFET